MQLVFGKTSDPENQGNYFEGVQEGRFFFSLDVDDDTFSIQDANGNMLIFDKEDQNALGVAVFAAGQVYKAADESTKLYASRYNELQAILQSFNVTQVGVTDE